MNLLNPKIQYEARLKQLKKCIPDVFDYVSLLYIGVNQMRNQMVDDFLKEGYKVDIVEAFEDNFKHAEKQGIYRQCYFGDIQDIHIFNTYDIIMFWHGIEHIYKEDLPALTKKLLKYKTQYLIYACPYGIYKQGSEYDNPYENHRSHYYPNELLEMGFKVDTIGKVNQKGSNLLAWS